MNKSRILSSKLTIDLRMTLPVWMHRPHFPVYSNKHSYTQQLQHYLAFGETVFLAVVDKTKAAREVLVSCAAVARYLLASLFPYIHITLVASNDGSNKRFARSDESYGMERTAIVVCMVAKGKYQEKGYGQGIKG